MPDRKETRKYVFTVEGETEQWYLYWLRDLINSMPESRYKVSIDATVCQKPLSYAKKVNPLATPAITHLCDIESPEQQFVDKFTDILSQMKQAKTTRKGLDYKLGYSNLTFELWLILHKQSCNAVLTDRSQYLQHINRAFDESFESMKRFKEKGNFERCLRKLTLDDVRAAIKRSHQIMKTNSENGLRLYQYNGFEYYLDNPSLTVYESVEKILGDNKLL